MGIHITYRKDFDENGNEKMVEVSREEFDDPIPLPNPDESEQNPDESLEQKAERLMKELQEVLIEIKNNNQ